MSKGVTDTQEQNQLINICSIKTTKQGQQTRLTMGVYYIMRTEGRFEGEHSFSQKWDPKPELSVYYLRPSEKKLKKLSHSALEGFGM